MKRPEVTPLAVVQALERFAGQHAERGETLAGLLARLGWDALSGCYYFWCGDLFHGVEVDGYIHT